MWCLHSAVLLQADVKIQADLRSSAMLGSRPWFSASIPLESVMMWCFDLAWLGTQAEVQASSKELHQLERTLQAQDSELKALQRQLHDKQHAVCPCSPLGL